MRRLFLICILIAALSCLGCTSEEIELPDAPPTTIEVPSYRQDQLAEVTAGTNCTLLPQKGAPQKARYWTWPKTLKSGPCRLSSCYTIAIEPDGKVHWWAEILSAQANRLWDMRFIAKDAEGNILFEIQNMTFIIQRSATVYPWEQKWKPDAMVAKHYHQITEIVPHVNFCDNAPA